MPLPAAGVALAFWASITAFIARIVPQIVIWVIVALGISTVSFVGLDFLVDEGIDLIQTRYNNLPADILSLVNVMGVLDAINILVAAQISVVAIKSLTAGKKIAFTGFNLGS